MAMSRKRVYAVPVGPSNKRRNYGTKFRRNRRTRFKRGRFGNNSQITTNGMRGTGLSYRARKTSKRAYKKRLWDSSTGQEHFRSAAMYAFTVTPIGGAGNATRMGVNTRRALNVNFSSTTDGAQFPVLPTTVFARDLIIRGGKVMLTGVNNQSTIPYSVKVWLMRTIGTGGVPPPNNYTAAWDPTLENGFNTQFRIVRDWKFILEASQSFSIEHRLGTRVWDFGHSPNEYQLYWVIGVTDISNSGVGLPTDLAVSCGHNLSFTGDSIV